MTPTICGVVFFHQVQLHPKLANLAFELRDTRFTLNDDARLCFFIIAFTAVDPRQPRLNEVRKDAVSALRITPSDDTVSDAA